MAIAAAELRFLHSKGVATNMTCTRMVCSPTENGWMFEFFEVPQSSGSTVIAVDRALNCTGGWVP